MSKSEIICGRNAVLEMLRAGKRRCHELFVLEGRREHTIEPLLVIAQQRGIPVRVQSRAQMAELAQVEKHQGIAARVDALEYATLGDVLRTVQSQPQAMLLILDGVLDPQNVGSLLRTAHQLGAAAVILPQDNAAGLSPASIRTSAGAAEYLPVVQVTNLSRTIDALKEQHFWVFGAAAEEAESLYHIDFTGRKVALVLGSEGKGVRRLVREHCDQLVAIPMRGRIDSLNVSAAGAIILAEIARQQAKSGKTP